VEFVRLLLLFFHLLGLGILVGVFLMSWRAAAGSPVNVGWVHGAALQLVTGMGILIILDVTRAPHIHAPLVVKFVVTLAIGGLALVFRRRGAAPNWLNPTLGALVVLNVGLAVFWN
jgi:hypothetical protein